MTSAKQDRQTQLIELVETHNIMKSITRIRHSPGYDPDGRRWKRALYHALGMAYLPDSTIEKIRQALGLP